MTKYRLAIRRHNLSLWIQIINKLSIFYPPLHSSRLFRLGYPCPTPPLIVIFHIPYALISNPNITLSRIQLNLFFYLLSLTLSRDEILLSNQISDASLH